MGMHIGTPVSGGTHTTYVKAGNTADAGSWGVKSFTSSGTFITKVPILTSQIVSFMPMRRKIEKYSTTLEIQI